MPKQPDLVWSSDSERMVISPGAGGRILSWQRGERELVMAPLIGEGGLYRVLFAEEQYPGTSYASPHRVLRWEPTAAGFTLTLGHYWNLPNWFLRRAGWPEKANELLIDHLALEKTLTYDAARSVMTCELHITNLADVPKYLTPWLHLSFNPWPSQRRVYIDGRDDGYAETDIYWGGHPAQPGQALRLALIDPDTPMSLVLGAAPDHLLGVAAMLPVPGEFHQSSAELRYGTIAIGPGQRWRAISFLAVTDDPARWAVEAPCELLSVVEPAEVDEVMSPALLDEWMLPEEATRGLMVCSYLDKAPFFSSERFFANHSFGGFHNNGEQASAHVMLYASKPLQVTAKLAAPDGWAVDLTTLALAAHDFVPLTLTGPADLRGQEAVRVTLRLQDDETITIDIPTGTVVEPCYPYAVRQSPAYLERRYAERTGPAPDADADAIRAWQQRTRARFRQYLDFNADGPCAPDPRLVERQEGPTCIREKLLIQTEPGIWTPGFLIRPKGVSEPLPLIYSLHGSGPGKDLYAPDETLTPVRSQLGHEAEYLPYVMARELGCLVYVPDGRGQGEMGESIPSQAHWDTAGINSTMLRVTDMIRALDWLITLPEVDAARIGSVGCSGGGNMTYVFAAADERVQAAMVISTDIFTPLSPLEAGYFQRRAAPAPFPLNQSNIVPINHAPMGMLIAPRPMWIIDGLDDLGIAEADRPAWRRVKQIGRDQIHDIYARLGAEDRFQDSWLPGGHCAGLTGECVVRYFRKWFG